MQHSQNRSFLFFFFTEVLTVNNQSCSQQQYRLFNSHTHTKEDARHLQNRN